MSREITISKATGDWVVRSRGAILGESSAVLQLDEDGYEPVIYFPREDIEMAFLEPSDHRTTCPHKGEASYFDLMAKSGTVANAVWSYENPKDAVREIAGYLAFDPKVAEVEQL